MEKLDNLTDINQISDHIPYIIGTLFYDELGDISETWGMKVLTKGAIQGSLNKVKNKWKPHGTKLITPREKHKHCRFAGSLIVINICLFNKFAVVLTNL